MKLIGYNCKVCHGAEFQASGNIITHMCEGFAEPVYESKVETSAKKARTPSEEGAKQTKQ